MPWKLKARPRPRQKPRFACSLTAASWCIRISAALPSRSRIQKVRPILNRNTGMRNIPRLIVSATRGGLGKTTISLGITAAWRGQGRRVAVFKKGPDFIDAGWLGKAAGRPCYNLDLFMMEGESILRSFQQHTDGVDAAVVEGNRGLFDGVDESGRYSTARLAKLLKTPVVLIVDCTK